MCINFLNGMTYYLGKGFNDNNLSSYLNQFSSSTMDNEKKDRLFLLTMHFQVQ